MLAPSNQHASTISRSRRTFLRNTVGALAASASNTSLASVIGSSRRTAAAKTVIVTFGGGARDDETFSQDGKHNIPILLRELAPQGTFFSQVVNAGILGHYVATASVVTGTYERFNNFVAQPPPNPTIFEYFRRELGRPASDAWVIAPSNGFQRIGTSDHRLFGPRFGAGVILPKQLLNAALHGNPASVNEHLASMLQDSYDTPIVTPLAAGDRELRLEMLESTLRISIGDFIQHAKTLDSADELSIFITRQLMKQQAPSLLLLTLHDMDIAHSGAYSLYVDAIQRADRLCGDLWSAIQNHGEYKDRTTLYILPDFGRDADEDPAGNGFQHHRTGGAVARTTWMLVLGPHVRQNVVIDRRIESIDLVPTIGQGLGFATPYSGGRPIVELS